MSFGETLNKAYGEYLTDSIFFNNEELLIYNIAISYINENFSDMSAFSNEELGITLSKVYEKSNCYKDIVANIGYCMLLAKMSLKDSILESAVIIINKMLSKSFEEFKDMKKVVKYYCREFNLNLEVMGQNIETFISLEDSMYSDKDKKFISSIIAKNLFDFSTDEEELKKELYRNKELLKTTSAKEIYFNILIH